MTDLQMQYLRGQVIDREATIERQAALLKMAKIALGKCQTYFETPQFDREMQPYSEVSEALYELEL